MSTIFQFILVVSLVLGCIRTNNPIVKKVPEHHIEEFKRSFFLSCIDYGYKGNYCMDSIINMDISLMGDFPLGFIGYGTADSLAREVRQEIMSDSIKLLARPDHLNGKKRVFQICLKHYTSSKIDSIAREVLSRD